ncbi:3-hydroxyacyl-CoA dehydrogenase [Caballeronia concitans]|uniref:L-gulonate 3-dehydrogenase n=1 Tax=Caballeronia concitans TaxID=1777133 RepID=A0A658QTM5_9BURK|nr:3-hydroxyacyl-CoA dehydrogenase [Caballeronia concitans]KIG01927.1 3-hydroxyacyl-CoA dehydrogenase [Burkholderia sp. MR1]SAL20596.1 3-hydroxyacyl-CoA dehydrogenase [Caballeronia concitans]
MEKIAIIGAGLIGCAWASVFARAGHTVALFDIDTNAVASARDTVKASLVKQHAAGLITEDPETVLSRVSATGSLEDAVRDADFVQENVRETVDAKKEIYAKLDRLVGPRTLLASSTSGIPASAFTEGIACRERCFVGHPINPPSVVPLVELVPAPWTDPAVIERARAIYARAGQVPIVVSREIQGFIVNRLQGALLAEAFRLVEDGYVSGADIDKAVKDGLGLRWSFMGPMETIDLNAPGGIRDYCARYGPLYHDIAKQAAPRAWTDALIGKLEQERLAALPAEQRPARNAWRDQRLMNLVAHKRSAPQE